MAKRKILILGQDEQLRKRCRPVDKFDERLHTLLDDMAETMYDSNGAGLAAPQVGILKRAVVIDVGDEHGLVELINPEIVAAKGEREVVESCLSVPDKCGLVKRPVRVTVKAFNRFGEPVEYTGEDFFGLALCHETEHLDGKLYVDSMIEDVSDRYRQVKK